MLPKGATIEDPSGRPGADCSTGSQHQENAALGPAALIVSVSDKYENCIIFSSIEGAGLQPGMAAVLKKKFVNLRVLVPSW